MNRTAKLSQSSFELAKWVAIAAMAVDHYGKIVAPDWYLPTHMIGRAAFPLFAWIIASRLAMRPELIAGYIRWLLPWAIVTQPAFYVAGREWFEPNILFELLAGVLVVYTIHRFGRSALSVAVTVVLAGVGWFFDYGPVGVLSIPLLFTMVRTGSKQTLAWLALIAVSVNLPAADSQDWWVVCAALSAPAIAALSLALQQGKLPRLPKLFFYAFYPLHLLFLTFLSRI